MSALPWYLPRGLYPPGGANGEERLGDRKEDEQIPKMWKFPKEIHFGFLLLSKINIL